MKFLQIWVDADACPVIEETIQIGRAHGVPVILVASICHRITAESDVQVIVVDNRPQEVDMVIINRSKPGDVVITSDIGLAALILGRRGHCLSHRGKIFRGETIDNELAERAVSSRIRRGGGRTKGPAAFTSKDRERFCLALEGIIKRRN